MTRNAEVEAQAAVNARAEMQTRVDAAGLAAAVEGLLGLVSELKIAAVVQDVAGSASEIASVVDELGKAASSATEELNELRDSVGIGLTELEDHYYRSMCAVPEVRSGDGER